MLMRFLSGHPQLVVACFLQGPVCLPPTQLLCSFTWSFWVWLSWGRVLVAAGIPPTSPHPPLAALTHRASVHWVEDGICALGPRLDEGRCEKYRIASFNDSKLSTHSHSLFLYSSFFSHGESPHLATMATAEGTKRFLRRAVEQGVTVLQGDTPVGGPQKTLLNTEC